MGSGRGYSLELEGGEGDRASGLTMGLGCGIVGTIEGIKGLEIVFVKVRPRNGVRKGFACLTAQYSVIEEIIVTMKLNHNEISSSPYVRIAELVLAKDSHFKLPYPDALDVTYFLEG